jgi:hypothetical protein
VKPENIKALRTLAGALYHGVYTYNDTYFKGNDWEHFCSHLHIPPATIHYVEKSGYGFLLHTKDLTFRYVHDDLKTDARVIEIRYGKKK